MTYYIGGAEGPAEIRKIKGQKRQWRSIGGLCPSQFSSTQAVLLFRASGASIKH